MKLNPDEYAQQIDVVAAKNNWSREEVFTYALVEFVSQPDLPELQDWQIAQIEEGMRQAKAGIFASKEELDAMVRRLSGRGTEPNDAEGQRSA